MRNGKMTLRLLLADNDEVLVELPLGTARRTTSMHKTLMPLLENLMQDLRESTRKRKRLSLSHIDLIQETMDAFSNRRRLMMLCELAKRPGDGLRFSDLKRSLKYNPKTVWEGLEKMQNAELVEKAEDKYRVSPIGYGALLTAILATRKMIEEFEDRTSPNSSKRR